MAEDTIDRDLARAGPMTFFNLPREIRDMIYMHLLRHEDQFLQETCIQREHTLEGLSVSNGLRPSLLVINRQWCDEYSHAADRAMRLKICFDFAIIDKGLSVSAQPVLDLIVHNGVRTPLLRRVQHLEIMVTKVHTDWPADVDDPLPSIINWILESTPAVLQVHVTLSLWSLDSRDAIELVEAIPQFFKFLQKKPEAAKPLTSFTRSLLLKQPSWQFWPAWIASLNDPFLETHFRYYECWNCGNTTYSISPSASDATASWYGYDVEFVSSKFAYDAEEIESTVENYDPTSS